MLIRTWVSYTVLMHLFTMMALLSYSAPLGMAFSPHLVIRVSPTIGKITSTGIFRRLHPQSQDTSSTCIRCSTRLLFSAENRDVAAPSKPKSTSVDLKGSWGSWAKVVSQREEQEQVLKKLRQSDSTNGRSSLLVRTGIKGDMARVSRLCIDTFRGPFAWWMFPLQLFQEFMFFGQINARLGLVTRNDIQHSMVVAEDTKSNRVVGFLEIGMLPPPTLEEQRAIDTDDRVNSVDGSLKTNPGGGGAGAFGDAADSMGVAVKAKTPDVAFLANVVVDRNQRRRGIGRTLVASALEVVRELWPEEDCIYVTVEQGNDIAIALYEGMGFELVAVESDLMAKSRRRAPRIYLSKRLA